MDRHGYFIRKGLDDLESYYVNKQLKLGEEIEKFYRDKYRNLFLEIIENKPGLYKSVNEEIDKKVEPLLKEEEAINSYLNNIRLKREELIRKIEP